VIAQVQTPGRRRRSESKKAAILDAAEALFVAEGYDPTGVDAIAARAAVSKRTVYDHFGDKETIFLRALERLADKLTARVRAAIDEELTPDREVRTALTAFALRIATGTFPSSDYAAFQRLSRQPGTVPRLPPAVRDRPERMLEERFAELAAEGALSAPDPGLAARHFTALTIRLALELRDETDPRAVIVDGVEAFLRAYR
jgi:TetR/AcrR family transcriptional repressor of mexJK operon